MASSHSSYITENLLSTGGFLLLRGEKYRIIRRNVGKKVRFLRKIGTFWQIIRRNVTFSCIFQKLFVSLL